MIRLLLFLNLVITGNLLAEEGRWSHLRLLDLDRFSLSLMKFGCNREHQTPDIQCYDYVGRVAAEFDLRMFNDWVFWRNEIHGEGVDAKFVTMGWHYEIGIDLGMVELFWEHHSKHVLDSEQPDYWSDRLGDWRQHKFPVEDSYGIRLNFYQRGK